MSSSWAAAAAAAGASVIEEFHTYWDGVDPQVEMVPGPKGGTQITHLLYHNYI